MKIVIPAKEPVQKNRFNDDTSKIRLCEEQRHEAIQADGYFKAGLLRAKRRPRNDDTYFLNRLFRRDDDFFGVNVKPHKLTIRTTTRLPRNDESLDLMART